MKIHFRIHYHTHWGQKLYVCGSSPALGEWNAGSAVPMHCNGGGEWVLDLAVPPDDAADLTYKYFVRDDNTGETWWEAGDDRHVVCEKGRFTQLRLMDAWRTTAEAGSALRTSAFTRCIFARRPATGGPASLCDDTSGDGPLWRLSVSVPRVAPGHVLAVSGSDPALGAWDPGRVVPMDASGFPIWQVDISLEKPRAPVRYKYVILEPETGRIVTWETGDNRILWPDSALSDKGLMIRSDEQFRHSDGAWRGAGVSIPVFSLRSRNGMGVGEFNDIKLLVDWAVEAGLSLIQLLPVNDTVASHGWMDSYPYAAISVFALHPVYMNVASIGGLSRKVARAAIEETRKASNHGETVDYEAVMRTKSRFYKLIFDEQREKFLNDPAFLRFFEENREWLVPYAVFSYLRDLYGTCEHTCWKQHRRMTRAQIAALAAPGTAHYDDIAVHYFIQYHLHRQLLDAAVYARSRGVVLKGDIPIGVYRYSVDTWLDPELFNMDVQAGAPPDAFAANGQNWSFPTYNWSAMAKDGYAWWRSRLVEMSKYFDAFRIDHILGFFRIWEIPWEHLQGIMGHFNPSIPLHPHEIEARGIPFDRERFCEPYIRAHMLGDLFGPYVDEVVRDYLQEYAPGCYRMAPGYETQRDVDEKLPLADNLPAESRARVERIRNGLFSLHSEVLFLEAPGYNGECFDPRSTFQSTRSFQDLGHETQARLNELYVDYFYRRHEHFWRDQAMIRLPVIKHATNMLICGEDLGMVPDCVPGVMQELGLLSLCIQRMPHDPRREFGHPADYPYLSVCSTSTHDMSVIRGWWEEDRGRSQRFYNQILGHHGGSPHFCEPWICRDIIVQHLYSPSMWAVFPIQDLLAMDGSVRRNDPADEQINEPANQRHYWCYRLHVDLADLMGNTAFNDTLHGMIAAAGRSTH